MAFQFDIKNLYKIKKLLETKVLNGKPIFIKE